MNELVKIGPISPLRQRLLDDMALRRFGSETQRNYLRDVSRFATWLQRSPHTATAEDIRQFQFEQLEAGVPAPTMNSIVGALRFFFTHTLDRPDLARKLIRTKQVRKIPVVLTMAEVTRHGSSTPIPGAALRPEADPLALALPKSRRRYTKIGPSAFRRPLLRSKFRRSALRCVPFWAASVSPRPRSKPLSP